MSQLTFYTNPMSRGRIVRWMLEEIGVPYETKILDYGTTMKSADYLAINPMGKVPAIQHGDTIVTEVPAICTYLADTFKEAGLASDNEHERGLYYRWLFFGAGPLQEALSIKMLGVEPTKEQERSLSCGNIHNTFDTLAKAVSAHQYITGGRFTAADVYIGSYIGFGMHMGSIDKRPELIAYWERISKRPARERALAQDGAI